MQNSTNKKIFGHVFAEVEDGEKYFEIKKDTSVNGRVIWGYANPGTTEDSAEWLVFAEDTLGNSYHKRFAESPTGTAMPLALHVWNDRKTILPALGSGVDLYSTTLDGTEEYLNGGDVHNYDIADPFSIALWLNPDDLAAQRMLFSKLGTDGYSLRHNVTDGLLYWKFRTTTTNKEGALTGLNLTSGAWQLVTFTYSGGSNTNGISGYLNTTTAAGGAGALSGTMIDASPSDFLIGMRSATSFFKGKMAQITVWNTELTADDVTELYNAGTMLNPLEHTKNANLTSWYRMGDNDSSPTIADNIGSAPLGMNNMDSTNFVLSVPGE